ncbi:hypothetical protein SUDANB106_05195 [Streptomyces sp. enrichment culture]
MGFATGLGAENRRDESDHGNLSVDGDAEGLRIALPFLAALR